MVLFKCVKYTLAGPSGFPFSVKSVKRLPCRANAMRYLVREPHIRSVPCVTTPDTYMGSKKST